ncbi:MAG: cyanophycin synthetase, partial [Candidatus Omnitrophota bacterium]
TVVGKDMPYVMRKMTPQGVTFDVEGRRIYAGLYSSLIGEHQVKNAALAMAMAEDLETFGFVITEEAVREGVADVAWPARFETVSVHPTVILDCAHTLESAQALKETFQAVFPGRQAVVVLGMSRDKDAAGFEKTLEPITQELILAKADHPRAMDWKEALLVPEAIVKAKTIAGVDGIIVVTGSVFVCAQAAR